MTILKSPLVVDVAYNNVTMVYDPIKKKDIAIPPDWTKVDWNLVKGVICKATEYQEDSTFGHNWKALGELNKPRGAYHFYHPMFAGTSGQQAKRFADTINKYGGLKAGDVLVLDAESQGMSISALVDFIYNVERLLGIKPIIYSTASILNSLNHRKLSEAQKRYLKDTNIWIAGYPNEPDKYPDPFKAGYIPDQNRYGKVVMWQYDSEVPNVGNIPGGMDVNWVDPEFYMDWAAWNGPITEIPIETEEDKFEDWWEKFTTLASSTGVLTGKDLAWAGWLSSSVVDRCK